MPRRKLPPSQPDPTSCGPGTPVAIYARDSGGPEQERSVPEQLEQLEQYARERSWVVVARYIDVARSGTDPERFGLRRMLDALKNNPPFRLLLVWSYSRLARELSILFEIAVATRRAGVGIVSATEPVDPMLRDLLESLYGWQAKAQSDKISTDITRGMRAMVRAGFAPGGRPPWGYRVEHVQVGMRRDGSPRLWPRWVKDEAVEQQVELMWRLRQEGASYATILAACGISCKESLRALLRNPAYCGFPRWYLRYHGLTLEECAGREPAVPPYVSLDLFLQLQQAADDHPRRVYASLPLSGLAYCGYCGALAHGWRIGRYRCAVCASRWPRATPNCPGCGAPYSARLASHRYVCSRHHSNAARCPQSPIVGGRKLEVALRNEISRLILERLPGLLAEINEALRMAWEARQAERQRLEQELQEAQLAAARLVEALEKGGPSASLLERLRMREEEIGRLRAACVSFSVSPAPHIEPRDLPLWEEFLQEKLAAACNASLRRLFQAVGLKVWLYRGYAEAELQWPPVGLFISGGVVASCMPLDGLLLMPPLGSRRVTVEV